MEYVLLAIVLTQTLVIAYLLVNTKKPIVEEEKPVISELEKEITRQENIDKSFQKLFNYNEDIATKGYRE